MAQLELGLKLPKATTAKTLLATERARICQEIDAYVKKTAIKYVPIEVLKEIINGKYPS